MRVVRIANEKAWYIYHERKYWTGNTFSLLMCDAHLFTTLEEAEKELNEIVLEERG